MLEAYNRAALIYGANAKKHVLNETIAENWIDGSEDFWFARDVEGPDGKITSQYERYISERQTTSPLFDHESFAKATAAWSKEAVANDLPVEIHEVSDITGCVYFSIKGVVGEFTYNLESGQVDLLRFPLHARSEVTSPDKKYSAFVRDYNVIVRCNDDGRETQLTFDGSEDLAYALRFSTVSEKLTKKEPRIMPPAFNWSPNSRFCLTYRRDTRRVDKLHLVQSVPFDGRDRPVHASYPYSLPGDEDILTSQVYVLDLHSMTAKKVLLNGAPLELLLLYMFGSEGQQVKWAKDGNTAYLVRSDRYFKTTEAVLVNAKDATARVGATCTYSTFSFTEYFGVNGHFHFPT